MSSVTPEQIDLLRHALGVQMRGKCWSLPYRNHFVAGDDHIPLWDDLVARGLAVLQSKGNELSDGMPIYAVTDQGRARALVGIFECTPTASLKKADLVVLCDAGWASYEGEVRHNKILAERIRKLEQRLAHYESSMEHQS